VLLPQLVSDDEVAAARARVAARAGLGRSDAFPSASRIDTALGLDSGASDGIDEDVDTLLLDGPGLQSQIGPPRGPSTAELSSTAERLRSRLDPVSAVTKMLEEVDASRHELARMESEHQQVNQLLRAAVTDGGSGSLDRPPDPAVAKSEQTTRLARGHEPLRSTGRRKAAARRLNPGPSFAARRRLAAGRSEWSSDSDSDDDTVKQQQGQGGRDRHVQATIGPSGSYPRRARRRSTSSDPWTEATSPDADAKRAATATDGGWKHPPSLGTNYRDTSLSRRIDTAAEGWDFDDSRSSVGPEPEPERSTGFGGATGPPKQRGAGGKRRTARSMYEPPAAKGYSRW
jgi:hypothetical protein